MAHHDPPRARRTEAKPTTWRPRPIPQVVPERRTADPETPTLRQLEEREQQRASLLPENGAPATQVPPEPPTNPCAKQGDLANPAAAAAVANGMRELQGKWPGLDEGGKLGVLQNLVNAPLKSAGVPTVTVVSAELVGERTGLFDAPNWLLQIRKSSAEAKTLSDADAQDLAKTAYHEAVDFRFDPNGVPVTLSELAQAFGAWRGGLAGTTAADPYQVEFVRAYPPELEATRPRGPLTLVRVSPPGDPHTAGVRVRRVLLTRFAVDP